MLEKPGQRQPHVCQFTIKLLEQPLLRWPANLGIDGLSDPKVVLRVSAPEDIFFARFLEPLERVLADRLQHPVALACAADEALVDERRSVSRSASQTVFGRLERAAAGEYREPTKSACSSSESRSWLHAIVARSVRCRSGASRGAAGEERQSVLQPLEDRCRREHLDAGGGELDRERQVVEAAADLDDRPVRIEVGLDRSRALDGTARRLLLPQRRTRYSCSPVEVQWLADS